MIRWWCAIQLYFLVFVSALIINNPVSAKNIESIDDFQRGVEYFNNADYPSALRYFTQALSLGERSEKLHYNLGVTYYKLNNYKKALVELNQAIVDPKLASAAHFNSGLIYAKLGQNNLAQFQFQLAYHSSITEKQKSLALHGLKKIGKSVFQNKRKKWSVREELNYGVNDNVTRAQRPGYESIPPSGAEVVDTLKISDEYRLAYVVANFKLYKQINLGGFLYDRRYATQKEYRVRQQNIHIDLSSSQGGNLYLIAAAFDSIQLGGRDYLDSWSARLQGSFRLSPRAILASQFYLRNYSAKGNSTYDFLQGKLNHFQSKLTYRFNRTIQLGFDYRFEVYNKDDIQNSDGSTRISYSPISNRYGIDMKINFTNSLWLQFDRYNRVDSYPEEQEQVEIQNCGLIDPSSPIPELICVNTIQSTVFRRSDTRKVLVSDFVWRVYRQWMFKLSYQFIKHESNKATQSYENKIYYLGTVVEF